MNRANDRMTVWRPRHDEGPKGWTSNAVALLCAVIAWRKYCR